MDSLHSRFRHARRARGLTQREVAKSFGVDPQTVSRWERGESPLTLPTLELAAKVFDVDRVWLVFGEGPAPQALPSVRPPSEIDAEDESNSEPREGAA
jgi:transcriptional regulator with XRE-family HTH domain